MKGVSVGKRTGSLALAVGLAALSSVALISYVKGIERRAYAGIETVQVYVAKSIIPHGTPAEEAIRRGSVERTPIPRKVVADGAVTSLEDIRGKVADVTILAGEQIVGARWVTADRLGATLPIPTGHQAMSVQVAVPPGVSGFVQPGDRVSLLSQFELNVDKRGAWRNVDDPTLVKYVLQNVQVLAVGPRVAVSADEGDRAKAREQQQSATPAGQILLTLAVTPVQAEKLAYVAFGGKLWFTLVPPDQKPATTPGRHPLNILS